MTKRRVSIWLDDEKPEQKALLDLIAGWKTARAFHPKLRLALKMIASLDGDDPSILFQHYPAIGQKIFTDELLTMLNAPREVTTPARVASPRPMAPPPEDPELDIQAVTSDENPAYNMALQLASLNGRYADLPREVLAYGLRKGKISRDRVPHLREEDAPPGGGPKRLAGSEVTFSPPPSEDDITLDVTSI